MPEGVSFTRPAGRNVLVGNRPGRRYRRSSCTSPHESKVVFVPGVNFYPGRDVHDGMRLNFSNASEKNIRVGVERLAHAISAYKG